MIMEMKCMRQIVCVVKKNEVSLLWWTYSVLMASMSNLPCFIGGTRMNFVEWLYQHHRKLHGQLTAEYMIYLEEEE